MEISQNAERASLLHTATFLGHDDLISALLSALDAHDRQSGVHARATGVWAQKIGQEFGFNEDSQIFLRRCGELHDIGKISIPTSILQKPGTLTEPEWDRVREHPEAGKTIVDRIPALRDYAPIILAHHERFDGVGYPYGLKGTEIPIEARVIAVADAWDAMLGSRPYRTPMSTDEALLELKHNRGTQFDPEVVDAFVRVVTKRGGPARRALDIA